MIPNYAKYLKEWSKIFMILVNYQNIDTIKPYRVWMMKSSTNDFSRINQGNRGVQINQ